MKSKGAEKRRKREDDRNKNGGGEIGDLR